MISHKVMRTVRTMTAAQRLRMLQDVIQNMAERNNAEEIAAFLNAQCGGDDEEITFSYAGLDRHGNAKPRRIKDISDEECMTAAGWNDRDGEGPAEISRRLNCSYNTADAAITRGRKLKVARAAAVQTDSVPSSKYVASAYSYDRN